MTKLELQQYLLREYPQENARCEWKEFKNLKNSFCGDEKDDVISYVSAIANMEGGFLVVGVHQRWQDYIRLEPIQRLTVTQEVILSPLLILQSLIGHYLLLGRMMQPKQNGGHWPLCTQLAFDHDEIMEEAIVLYKKFVSWHNIWIEKKLKNLPKIWS